MRRSPKKQIEKEEYQDKVNPGHRQKYNPPLRLRSTVFKSKKGYNRQNNKKDIEDATEDYL